MMLATVSGESVRVRVNREHCNYCNDNSGDERRNLPHKLILLL
jgi:hypothetical protein